MKTNISPRDLELLSEYLDSQLPANKRGQLEARLKENPELRAALQDLAHTRTLLRSLPALKAPRNFTLTPQMVGQRPARRVYPVFQFASALASILFVVVLLADFLGFGSRPSATFRAGQVQATNVAMQAAPAVNVPSATQEKSTPTLNPTEAANATQAPAGLGAGQELLGTPAPAPLFKSQESTGITVTTPTSPEITTSQSLLDRQQPPAAAPEPGTAQPVEATSPSAPAAGLPLLRILEISFGLLAVGSGLVAVLLRRGSGG